MGDLIRRGIRVSAYRVVCPIITVDAMLLAVRKKCLDCCGGSRKAVDGCRSDDCALHAYRTIRTLLEDAGYETGGEKCDVS